MTFNPDISKQAQEVIFFRKTEYSASWLLNMPESLWLVSWWKVKFLWPYQCKNFENKMRIGIIKKLSNIFPRNSRLTINKSFTRPHCDYCDIIHDQPNDESLFTKIEHIQYNAALSITGATKGTSRTKLFKKVGL